MRNKKFTCGSVVVGFRLPIDHKEALKLAINKLIDGYLDKHVDTGVVPLKEVVSTVIEPKAVKVVKEVVKVVEPTVMASECGCEYVGTLFMRSKGCKIPKEHHLPV